MRIVHWFDAGWKEAAYGSVAGLGKSLGVPEGDAAKAVRLPTGNVSSFFSQPEAMSRGRLMRESFMFRTKVETRTSGLPILMVRIANS